MRYAKKGKPSPQSNSITGSSWSVIASFKFSEEAIQKELNTKGRFILATNDLDEKNSPENSIIKEYKEQQLGKPVQNPTMRCVFKIMSGISIVRILSEACEIKFEIVSNMIALRSKILSFLERESVLNTEFLKRSAKSLYNHTP